jgi:hypothetical protein
MDENGAAFVRYGNVDAKDTPEAVDFFPLIIIEGHPECRCSKCMSALD